MSDADPDAIQAHANALLIGENGLLLRGPPGSGKSSLTYMLLARTRLGGGFARLIADDRVELCCRDGRLIARPHPLVAGKIELRGLGIVDEPFASSGVIRGVVDLVPSGDPPPERYPAAGDATTLLCGLSLPRCFMELRDPAVVEKILLFWQHVDTK